MANFPSAQLNSIEGVLVSAVTIKFSIVITSTLIFLTVLVLPSEISFKREVDVIAVGDRVKIKLKPSEGLPRHRNEPDTRAF